MLPRRERCVHDAYFAVEILSQGVRILLGLEFAANGAKVCWIYAPERLEVYMDLVVFVRQLDAIVLNILPP